MPQTDASRGPPGPGTQPLPRALCPALLRLRPFPPDRVFSDRLVDAADMEAFVGIISDKLGSFFDLTFHNLCPTKRSPIFGEWVLRPLQVWEGAWEEGRAGPRGLSPAPRAQGTS